MVSSVRPTASCFRRLSVGPARVARGLAKAAPALVLAATLAGCGDTSVGSSLMNWTPGSKPAETAPQDPKALAKFQDQPTCPNAEIRYGTEMINLFADGKQGDENSLKYQINVQRVARDCDQVGETISVRVGIAGLIVGGPKGAAGKVDVPIRIAAVKGDKVVYTELKTVSVQVQAPDFNGNWSLVDPISIPAAGSSDTIIYVGLDDKSKAAAEKPHEAKPHPHKPKPPAEPADPYPQMRVK